MEKNWYLQLALSDGRQRRPRDSMWRLPHTDLGPELLRLESPPFALSLNLVRHEFSEFEFIAYVDSRTQSRGKTWA